MELYTTKNYSSEKYNAQLNLEGRTHYVDDSSLRFHHARIIYTNDYKNGLIFGLIESVALDMNNTKRGFRYVLFDLFGNVVSRVDLEDSFKTSKVAKAAMDEALKALDVEAITKEGLASYDKASDYARERILSNIEKAKAAV